MVGALSRGFVVGLAGLTATYVVCRLMAVCHSVQSLNDDFVLHPHSGRRICMDTVASSRLRYGLGVIDA